MGNSQYCCNYKDLNDPHAQDFNDKKISIVGGKGAPSPITNNKATNGRNEPDQSAKDELLKHAKKDEDKIVKMQANIRGYL